MYTILISNIISTKVLSSRPSARLLESAVADAALASDDLKLAFDLHDKLAMTPSFFDERIRIVPEGSEPLGSEVHRIELLNVSSKFHAVCKSHHFSLTELAPGHWITSNP